MSISTKLRKVVRRNKIAEGEDIIKNDILRANEQKLKDISQRRGLTINSGLSVAERDYILSDSMIASAIQLYLADVLAICSKKSSLITSEIEIRDEKGELAEKLAKVKYVFKKIYTDALTEAITINLLNNGEIFLETKYKESTKKYTVVETSYTCCTQLCYSDGSVATYLASDAPSDNLSYSYTISNTNKTVLIKPEKMVRVYSPTLVNSKVCIELDKDSKIVNELDDAPESESNEKLYYTNSQSLLKQVYPDWLNSKLLELAVYRDRIAKSRFIQLIAVELGRTSKITSDQIYDSVAEYFAGRAVIDLDKQTFKSVVGDEPFTDYKVYTTRNGVGQISFDSSLNGSDANVSSLADLEYNQTKVFAGLGIPKQYLGADDNGSALSNGGSLFFIDEKYKKRVLSYVKRIAEGYKNVIKNLIIQEEGKEYFQDWDFDIEFEIPESNEDVYRVKSTRLEYVNAILDLIDRIEDSNIEYAVDAISVTLQEDLAKFTVASQENNKKETNNGEL